MSNPAFVKARHSEDKMDMELFIADGQGNFIRFQSQNLKGTNFL